MANIGIVGFGKLGCPIGVSFAYKGHRVLAYDVIVENVICKTWPWQEQGYDGRTFDELRHRANIEWASVEVMVHECEVIFVVVQTPHEERYEGITRLPDERVDFDYSFLMDAVADVAVQCVIQRCHRTVAVVSTVLPGTIRREIEPLCGEWVMLVYNPAFAAMGYAMRDYLNPEFVVVGTRDGLEDETMAALWQTMTDAPVLMETYETAEAIKVLYNTYVTSKICYANAVMEVCHKMGAHADRVTDAMALATRRITSSMYMRGGMGDGGACHPRDLIALSWLSRELDLSYDIFGTLAMAREKQAEWLCNLVTKLAKERGLHPFILGTAFKAGTNLEIGSSALLCKAILEETWGKIGTWDPVIESSRASLEDSPHVYLIGCNHPSLIVYPYPPGSVVVDPWRMIPDQAGVTVLRVGG